MTTNASNIAVGAVLSQGPIGRDLPIAYTSRTLNKAEQNYSTTEKECLAFVYATNYFRPYLYGREFTFVSDHRPLVWLHSVKDPSSRLVRWHLRIAKYQYQVVYKSGKTNLNADALSRNPVPDAIVMPVRQTNNKKGLSEKKGPGRPSKSSVPKEDTAAALTEEDYAPIGTRLPKRNRKKPTRYGVDENDEEDGDEAKTKVKRGILGTFSKPRGVVNTV